MKRIALLLALSLLILTLVGCTVSQLMFWRDTVTMGKKYTDPDSPLNLTPLAPVLGLLGTGLGLIKNILDKKIRSKGGVVMAEENLVVTKDQRNILSKIVGSKKYMAASIISAILVAVNSHYSIGIDPTTIATIVASLFGVAIAGNAFEDAMEKR